MKKEIQDLINDKLNNAETLEEFRYEKDELMSLLDSEEIYDYFDEEDNITEQDIKEGYDYLDSLTDDDFIEPDNIDAYKLSSEQLI